MLKLQLLNKIKDNYPVSGVITDYAECNNGHINDTYRVKVSIDEAIDDEYIFQRINHYVFKDPTKVMDNIREISLHRKPDAGCDIISFIDTMQGTNYALVDGEYWRVCHFVKNSVAYESVENAKVLYSAGYAFGRFQYMFFDFPMEKLHYTIPDFHNTRKRLENLFDIVKLDPLGRAADVREEIDFFHKNKDTAIKLVDMLEKGELPLRVTHNDTKYNNILMDKDTSEPLCVIDLDTVMPGLSMYDFGDAIRFAANNAVEDETDLTKATLNLEYYEEFTKGFMKASAELLTQNEIDNMALGAVVITMEIGSRFLADHIDGDKYFRVHRPNHNLDRARCQIALAQDMIKNYDEMRRIVHNSIRKALDKIAE